MSGSEGRLALVETASDEGLGGHVAQSIARATRYLAESQHALGYWQAPLEANATMEAEYVFFNRLLGRAKPDLESRIADRLLAIQQEDGSWPQYKEGPGNLSTSIEAYFALKLTGLAADEPAMQRARDFILGKGGLAKAGVFTRIWLSYFGQFPRSGVPAMPVELCLLGAELQHVSQDRHRALALGQRRQGLQRRVHGAGVRVVAVINDGHAISRVDDVEPLCPRLGQ